MSEADTIDAGVAVQRRPLLAARGAGLAAVVLFARPSGLFPNKDAA